MPINKWKATSWQLMVYGAMVGIFLSRLWSIPHWPIALKKADPRACLLALAVYLSSVALIETSKRLRRERAQMKEESGKQYVS